MNLSVQKVVKKQMDLSCDAQEDELKKLASSISLQSSYRKAKKEDSEEISETDEGKEEEVKVVTAEK